MAGRAGQSRLSAEFPRLMACVRSVASFFGRLRASCGSCSRYGMLLLRLRGYVQLLTLSPCLVCGWLCVCDACDAHGYRVCCKTQSRGVVPDDTLPLFRPSPTAVTPSSLASPTASVASKSKAEKAEGAGNAAPASSAALVPRGEFVSVHRHEC
jgi:hypothetical protein